MIKDLLIEVIDDEIKWSKNKEYQANNNITEEQAEWFIKGLEQSKLIINKVIRIKNESKVI